MSMYNMVCGNNPCFGILARILDTVEPLSEVPRFRDMYTRAEGDQLQIVLYTRTGGGNREEYEEQNNALAAHPLYVKDWDDDFDTTFAHFAFSVPPEFEADLREFHLLVEEHPKFLAADKKFQRALEAIKGTLEETPIYVDPEKFGEVAERLIGRLPNISTMEQGLGVSCTESAEEQN